jgi:N-acetylglucosaminyldiphosphoundecaprenol N-acetyl-beta-D-mannosaminyltransferase
MVRDSWTDKKLKKALDCASMVVTDGIGLVWAARLLRKKCLQRIPGIELMVALCEEAERYNWRVFVFGGRPQINEKAVQLLTQKYPLIKIVGYKHGYVEQRFQATLMEEMRLSKPDIVFVGLGGGWQEKWFLDNREKLPPAVFIGIGGSLDVLAGRLKRAPLIVRNIGLEWLWRLFIEPTRLGRQFGLAVFAARVLDEFVLSRATYRGTN